ncbi:YqfO family protein [Marinobacter qingdaonensis]|uniref:YqfO family protein n=1 Tax=Marinobacter qingdaonensis TaxID=3108486 RepID=A0ABU5NT96_9GAMM|nr:YqfO family protein [Marinobacter sp. ASW11-75]MEA1079035.1 YqfO family protein [Marinobacter sp. ASW11-75]MEE2761910.1 YqfO family protein [Pseudomonadota bacterium]MEE3118567.1 YqfO family protein [Pseudomonadota bacterium]
MYKLCYFVPESHLEQTKSALFAAGAGRIGDYDSCAWQCLGQGQFRPLEGSDPFLGQTGALETVDEYKVELVCADELIHDALKALKQAHPYEEPAYEVMRIEAL